MRLWTLWDQRAEGWRPAIGLILLAAAACEEARVAQQQPNLILEPERVDFGTVELTQERVEVLVVRNVENIPGQVGSVSVDDSCGGCFRVASTLGEVGSLSSVDLRVRFRPTSPQVATATLTVTGVRPAQTLRAQLIGRGSDARRPDIAVTPSAVDFGFVPAGGVAVSSFSVRSIGELDLLIDRVSVDPPDAPFRITTSTPTPADPGRLPPGASASVGLRAELPMTDTSTRVARILIETNVLEEKNVAGLPGVVAVPIAALGNLPPVAVTGDDLIAEPFTQVMLDGSMSFDQDNPQNLPLTFQWTLVDEPGGSQAELLGSRTAQPILRPELSGRYQLELVVTDGLGLESEPEGLLVEAIPDEAVRIELIWDHPDSDLDLHLIQEGGSFCDCNTSVHYRDCARTADWFPQTPGANPSLDVDDRSGFGPENINIEGHGPTKFIPDGIYTIAVHYFSTAEQVSEWPTTVSNATVRIFVSGFLLAQVTRAMTNEREVWTVGALRWPQQVFTLDGSVTQDQMCGAL